MTPHEDTTTSLVLSGGGSYAAYEVGVMAALFAGRSPSTGYTPFDPDLLVGTSAGAMNITVLSAQEVRTGSLAAAIEELRTIWIDRLADGSPQCGNGVYRIRGFPFYLLDRDCRRRGLSRFVAEAADDATVFLRGALNAVGNFTRWTVPPLRAVARSVDMSALISSEPFLETLRVILPLGDFAHSTRRLRIVATDLTTGRMGLFTEQDVRRLGYLPLRASVALPVFFPTQRVEGHDYFNGTTLISTPLQAALAESDTIHIVYMDPKLSTISRVRLENIVDAMDRLMVVNFAYMLSRDIRESQEINRALEMIEEGVTAESISPQDVHSFLRSLAWIEERRKGPRPLRRVTIHRYHPREDIGGDLGLMNLDRRRITQIIERGYRDAVEHNCEDSGCVLPSKPEEAWRREAPTVGAIGQFVPPVEAPPLHR